MSAGDQVRAILAGVVRAYQADPAYRQRADVHNELDRIGRRLNQPIRIALAGTLKAGKSTRSEERRVGKECSFRCRSRWSPYH